MAVLARSIFSCIIYNMPKENFNYPPEGKTWDHDLNKNSPNLARMLLVIDPSFFNDGDRESLERLSEEYEKYKESDNEFRYANANGLIRSYFFGVIQRVNLKDTQPELFNKLKYFLPGPESFKFLNTDLYDPNDITGNLSFDALAQNITGGTIHRSLNGTDEGLVSGNN